jgi:hypothetical protein
MMVSVLDGTQVLERRDCKTALLPNGQNAAIWRGLAFPILPDGVSIDVTQTGIPPEQCRPVALSPELMTISETSDAIYVFGSGSAIVREELITEFHRYDIIVERSGPYFGPQNDDLDCDWFIRLTRNETSDLTKVSTMVGRISPSRKTVDSASLRASLLETELANARATIAIERAQVAKLQLEIATLGESTVQFKNLEEALQAATAEAARLAAVAQAAEQNATPQKTISKVLLEEFADALEIFLPRSRLLRDSASVALIEFKDRRGLYRALQELHQQAGIPTAWKPVRSATGWIERHVSNGSNDSGRLYASLNKDDRIWDILLSHKSSQSRDIEWLQKR